MELSRKPLPQEIRLIELLIKKSSMSFSPDWKEKLLVKPMEDGGMGSLGLFPNGIKNQPGLLGKQVSEYKFIDEDGVEVIASLNVNETGDLYELDIWKTDFSPLIRIPDKLD